MFLYTIYTNEIKFKPNALTLGECGRVPNRLTYMTLYAYNGRIALCDFPKKLPGYCIFYQKDEYPLFVVSFSTITSSSPVTIFNQYLRGGAYGSLPGVYKEKCVCN